MKKVIIKRECVIIKDDFFLIIEKSILITQAIVIIILPNLPNRSRSVFRQSLLRLQAPFFKILSQLPPHFVGLMPPVIYL
jgi:hypothetical protein